MKDKKRLLMIVNSILGLIAVITFLISMYSYYDALKRDQLPYEHLDHTPVEPGLRAAIQALYTNQAKRNYDALADMTSGYLKNNILSHQKQTLPQTEVLGVEILDVKEQNSFGMVRTKVFLQTYENNVAQANVYYHDLHFFKENDKYMFYNMDDVSLAMNGTTEIATNPDDVNANVVNTIQAFTQALQKGDFVEAGKYAIRDAQVDLKKQVKLYENDKRMKIEFNNLTVQTVMATKQFAVAKANYDSKTHVGNTLIRQGPSEMIFYLENIGTTDKEDWKIYGYVNSK